MLNTGDQVTVMFNNRTYSGVVDPTGEESEESPAQSPPTVHPLSESCDGTREERQEDEPPQPKPLEQQEPTLDRQPRQEVKVETPSRLRTSPRKPKPKKRHRNPSASPPRVPGKKKKFVQKKEGNGEHVSLCFLIGCMHVG
jgi:hypothetical protein